MILVSTLYLACIPVISNSVTTPPNLSMKHYTAFKDVGILYQIFYKKGNW